MTTNSKQIAQALIRSITKLFNPVFGLTLDEKIRLARNKNTPPKTLACLAGDKNADVRCWVANNPNTPTGILVRLAKRDNLIVFISAVRNPCFPEEARKRLSRPGIELL
jgi:hypothetical protein